METLNNHLFVPTPRSSEDFDLDYGCTGLICKGEYTDVGYIKLPPGKYQILGLASSLTEEQWKGIAEQDEIDVDGGSRSLKIGFVNYGENSSVPVFETAKESGESFLKSNNLEAETTLVLKIM